MEMSVKIHCSLCFPKSINWVSLNDYYLLHNSCRTFSHEAGSGSSLKAQPFSENSIMTGIVLVTQRSLIEMAIPGSHECTGTKARLTLERGYETQPITDARVGRTGRKEVTNRHNTAVMRRTQIRVPYMWYLFNSPSLAFPFLRSSVFQRCQPQTEDTLTMPIVLVPYTILPWYLHGHLSHKHLHSPFCAFWDETTELKSLRSPVRGYLRRKNTQKVHRATAKCSDLACGCMMKWECLDANLSPELGTQSRALLMVEQWYSCLCSTNPFGASTDVPGIVGMEQWIKHDTFLHVGNLH